MRIVACLMLGLVMHVHSPSRGAEWRPCERLLDAISFVESTGGRFLYGDDGRSLGEFQMSEAAWRDVSKSRERQGLPVYSYRTHVFDRRISRIYAAGYLVILHRQLQTRLKRPPNPAELYAAYNLGLTGFARCQFDLSRVNPTTVRKGRIITEHLGHSSLAMRP
jgi:hypothetical protein